MLTFRRVACVLVACIVSTLISNAVLAAAPFPETCNAGEDNATLELVQVPSSLRPGVPGHVVVRAHNTTAFNRTWIGEEQKNFPYRLASWSKGPSHNNQVLWSNWACNGYNIDNNPLNQRAFISDVAIAGHPTPIPGCGGRTVAPNGTYDFSFDIVAPAGATGALDFSYSMVYDAFDACQGFFGDAYFVTIPIDNGPTCDNTNKTISDSQWLLQVWPNESFAGSTVEQSYRNAVGNGGFNFDWTANGASACAGREHYSARLSRRIFLDVGHYTFNIHVDDGVRLRINDATLLEEWRAPQVRDFTATYDVARADFYKIEVDYFQQAGDAKVSLDWFRDSTPAQAPPTNLTAQVSSADTILLTWTAASGATQYRVKRTTDPSPNATYTPIDPPTTDTRFFNVGLSSGTYYYVVTAIGSGESVPSNRAFATISSSPNPCTPSSQPTPDNAWLVEIFNNRTLAGSPVDIHTDGQRENGFTYQFGSAPSSCLSSNENYSIRFSRRVNFTASGDYRFSYTTDDGMRVSIDNAQVFSSWADPQIDNNSVLYHVDQGQHTVVVEYYQASGSAQANLSWTLEGSNPSVPGKPNGLAASAGDGIVHLTWQAPVTNPPLTYRLKRSEQACCYAVIRETQDGVYDDSGVINGNTYFYVVSAVNAAGQEGPDSDWVSAQPQSTAPANPDLTLELLNPLGAAIPPNGSLGLTDQGWPANNPLQVKVTLRCPANRATDCSGQLTTNITSPDGRLRVHGVTSELQCSLSGLLQPSQPFLRWDCPRDVTGGVSLHPGEQRAFVFRVVVQPSEQTTMNVRATWNTAEATQLATVPAASIHPLLVVPGILGTMPPLPDARLDPVLGVYEPLMEQLTKMGYEEGRTVFRMPYDWRNSNFVTAGLLKKKISEVLSATRSVPWIAAEQRTDLVVHSMGGLITRIYVQGVAWDENRNTIPYGNDIRKVVFVASPHRGFPETYKTYESSTWEDYLYDSFFQKWAMDLLFWPKFVQKRWTRAHPNDPVPAVCLPGPHGQQCISDTYTMTHDPIGGADSLRQMLPTEDVDQFFGPWLCDSYVSGVCSGPYPFRRPFNPLLNGLNAGVATVGSVLGPNNIYVIYGVDPNGSDPLGKDNTSVGFDVKAPAPVPGVSGWANGTPEFPFVSRAGDDLIPEYSLNLANQLAIPAGNVSKLTGQAARHKEIMRNETVQSVILPRILASLSPLPFTTGYTMPTLFLDPRQWYTLQALCPVNLLLTDPQGRRLGFDPASGVTYNEIPTAVYSAPNVEEQFLIMKDPIGGRYHLKITAFGNGPFSLHLNQLVPGAGSPRRFLAEGVVRTGEVREFDFDLDPTQPVTQSPPIADAGPDQTVPVGDACRATVTLDGSRSVDPDGEPLTYQWTGKFGFLTGVKPTVSLAAGIHDIRLVVLDGQNGGAEDTVRITVTAPPMQVEPHVTPSVLQPPDGTMRDVKVTVDVTSTCAGLVSCRLVDIDSDEGDARDWQITGPLAAKVRASRAGDGDGRKYKLRVECQAADGEPIRKTINVTVPPPGRMKGKGELYDDGATHKFDFDVWESVPGKDGGSVKLDVVRAKSVKDTSTSTIDKFRSTRVDSAVFSNDDDIAPGGTTTKVDTVKATGVGTWNAKSGYTFEMRATDGGEPGAWRDFLKLVVRGADGKSVVYIDEKIDSGNNESVKPPAK